MRPRKSQFSCTVLIPLNAKSTLEISTSAAHALGIISGETILPSQNVIVIGLDGKRLTKKDLVQMRDFEQ